MPQPNLINPIDVKIRQIVRGATIMDEDAREPVQQAARAVTKTVKGQVNWSLQYSSEPGAAGVVEGASGYVLFRYIDLAAQSVTINRGDCFKEIGGVECDVYVISLRPTGHHSDVGGPTMVKAFFADRQPSKQTRGVG